MLSVFLPVKNPINRGNADSAFEHVRVLFHRWCLCVSAQWSAIWQPLSHAHWSSSQHMLLQQNCAWRSKRIWGDCSSCMCSCHHRQATPFPTTTRQTYRTRYRKPCKCSDLSLFFSGNSLNIETVQWLLNLLNLSIASSFEKRLPHEKMRSSVCPGVFVRLPARISRDIAAVLRHNTNTEETRFVL